MGSWADNSLEQIHTPISIAQILSVDIFNVDRMDLKVIESTFKRK
jgi:hypothetical protein